MRMRGLPRVAPRVRPQLSNASSGALSFNSLHTRSYDAENLTFLPDAAWPRRDLVKLATGASRGAPSPSPPALARPATVVRSSGR
jgi:hypothetical protein